MIRLAIVAAALLAVLYAAASVFIADRSLSAERKPLDQQPGELGLNWEEVEFSPRGRQELRLRGWWLSAPDPRATVIRVHGVHSNRESLLGLSAALVRAGFSVLVFDLRGHGESDWARMGAGLDEREDVLGAIDYAVQERRSRLVLLHGNSFGGAIALMSGWREPSVTGVFADSAFASLSDLVAQEVSRRTFLPDWAAHVFRPGIVIAGRLFHGIDIGQVEPQLDAARYEFSLGLAHCRGDDRIPDEHLEQIAAATQVRPSLHVFEDCDHGDAWHEHPLDYEALVIGYFDERLGR
jgi:pimeloyl-ACP methyl ester carboxylesterase